MRSKTVFATSLWLILTLAAVAPARAQETAVVAPASEAADGLDLRAVGELFREARDAEDFERSLNDPRTGVNNLDLDDNGEVDYIRVLDEVSGDTHVLVMQVALSESEYQDVATIEIEKSGKDDYEVQLHGNEQLYGVNYYVRPVGATLATAAFIGWLYRPLYRPWRSPYYYGYYPSYWRPYPRVHVNVYRTRTVSIHPKVNYKVVHTSTVTSAKRVYVQPKSSALVKKIGRNPTVSQKEYGIRQTSKPVSSGGFAKTKTHTTVEGSAGGRLERDKTKVSGPRGGQAKRVETSATSASGANAERTKTKVSGPRGREVKRVKTEATAPSGATVERTKTKVSGPRVREAKKVRTKKTSASETSLKKKKTKTKSSKKAVKKSKKKKVKKPKKKKN